jgi:Bacterial protein of unknown function (DUF839)
MLRPSFLLVAAPLALLACDPDDLPPTPPGETPALSATAEAPGFVTSQPAQAHVLAPGARLKPILTVGDELPSGFKWAPIPDGLGAYKEGNELILFANHELAGITANDGQEVFANSRVSRLVLDPNTLSVKRARYVVGGTEGYQRLCSATWVDAPEGFPAGYFLTGEETEEGIHNGIQLAVDKQGRVTQLPWTGRYRHENLIGVPGFHGKVVLIGLDDTRGASELYMYVADAPGDVLTGGGNLYVLTSDEVANVAELTEGQSISGQFVLVPNAASLSYEALQETVEQLGAFSFVRLEGGDYDKRIDAPDVTEQASAAGKPQTIRPTVYFVDTGSAVDEESPESICSGQACDEFGSIYRLTLSNVDPTVGARLTLLARSKGADQGWASPDNVATSERTLMVQEDPAYPGFARAPRIYSFTLTPHRGLGGPGKPVVALNNSECSEPLGNCWETSGIIDASAWLGPGSWLFDVQAHSLAVPSLNLPTEGGQLLYLNVPGS